MISVCMIVKNESQYLAANLAAIRENFDDLVVVDTGSTDGSQEIAQGYTDQVHTFQWVDDFSAARNYSLTHAKHDWVLVVDADERIEPVDHAKLAHLLRRHPEGVGRVMVLNQVDEDGGVTHIEEPITRLFRKSLYHYEGIIHEQVCTRDGGQAFPRFESPIVLDHVGYRSGVMLSKDKLNRNIDLLRLAISREPGEPYHHYQLGQSLYLKKEYAQACGSFEKALSLQTDMRLEYNQKLIESFGYALINSSQYERAKALLAYEEHCPTTDFAFLKGLILMNNGDLQGAVDTFLRCTKMPAGRKEGVNTFKAHHNIGVILECAGRVEDALTFYRACEGYGPAQEGLQRLAAR